MTEWEAMLAPMFTREIGEYRLFVSRSSIEGWHWIVDTIDDEGDVIGTGVSLSADNAKAAALCMLKTRLLRLAEECV